MFGGEAIVLSRALCTFERRAAPRMDARGEKAVAFQVRHEAHFEKPGLWIEGATRPGPGEFNVWTWDQRVVDEARGRTDPVLVAPETAFHEPLSAGVRLARCLDGFEGQVWAEGELKSSRWWPREPGEGEWLMFIRAASSLYGAGVVASEAKPQAVAPPLRANLSLFSFGPRRLAALATPKLAFRALVLAAAPVLAFQAMQLVSLGFSAEALETRIANERGASAEFIRARNLAMRDAGRAERAVELGDETDILVAVSEVARLVTAKEARITRVVYREGDVEVQIVGDLGISGPDLVAALEATDAWSGVSFQSAPNGGVLLQGRVDGLLGRAP